MSDPTDPNIQQYIGASATKTALHTIMTSVDNLTAEKILYLLRFSYLLDYAVDESDCCVIFRDRTHIAFEQDGPNDVTVVILPDAPQAIQ